MRSTFFSYSLFLGAYWRQVNSRNSVSKWQELSSKTCFLKTQYEVAILYLQTQIELWIKTLQVANELWKSINALLELNDEL